MYKLRYSEAAEEVWDSLPDVARDEFERAIVAVCEDPYAKTESHGGDDADVKRILTLEYTAAMIVVIEVPTGKRVRVTRLRYIG
ncbi:MULTISPECIES: type II toxin-antitoxin system RelE family toxin [Streptomyces]